MKNADTMLAVRVLARIKLHSMQNKIKSSVIENEYQIRGDGLRDIIHTLRMAGEPIGSDSTGYWYASCYGEIQSTREGLIKRGKNIIATATHIAERFNGQESTIFE